MSDQVWALIFIIVVVVSIMAIIGQWLSMRGEQLAKKAEIAREEEYRKLAEQAVAAQRAIAAEQQKIAADLADLRARITSIEQVLHEVG